MRIVIKHKAPEQGITLPISYHHIIQSIIYTALQDSKYKRLHDKTEYVSGKREYRMFTFSEIFGKYKIHGKQITFLGIMSFKISGPNDEMICCIKNNIEKNGIIYGNTKCDNVEVQVEDCELSDITTETSYNVRMISPLVVYSTNPENRKTLFYEPDDEGFASRLQANFARKYQAFYGEKPEQLPDIKPVCVLPKNRKITNYKGMMITAWMGEYCISGSSEMLNFWIETGIGSKNSEGFGMCEIINR